jgi:hypothetical protein
MTRKCHAGVNKTKATQDGRGLVNLPIEVSAHAVDRLLGPRFKAGVENREMVDGWKKALCGFEVLSFTP